MSKPTFLFGAAPLLAALFLTAGCNHGREPDHMAEAQIQGEKPVAMKGDGRFFDGKVTALVTVSRGFGKGMTRKEAKGIRKQTEIKPELDNFTGLEDTSEEAQERYYEELVRRETWRRAGGSPLPPVTVRVNLQNQGSAPVEVEILEVNSDLGNFAVRPAKLALAAGETNQPNPMISQLGVTSDTIPVTVGLRIGGKKETQTILVKSIFTSIKK